jgi:hypothetical protein
MAGAGVFLVMARWPLALNYSPRVTKATKSDSLVSGFIFP